MTERLALRRPTEVDIDLVHSIHSDPIACLHNPSDMLTSRAEAEALFHRWNEHWQQHGFGYWIVHAGREGIGVCGLKSMTLGDLDVLNLLYRLSPTAWGGGFATEAATAVVQWADSDRPNDSVIARVRPANIASQRVAVKAGLLRAEHLDTPGEDGLDWIYARHLPS